jgi:hypothetical protein
MTLQGKYALRVAITNHRSRREDFEILLQEVLSQGRSIRRENNLEDEANRVG